MAGMPRQEAPMPGRLPTGPHAAYVPATNKSKPWLIAGAIVAILAVLFLGLFFSGLLKQRGDPSGSTLALRGEGGPPILGRGDQNVKMPQDILDWLEHLRKVDREKNDLAGKETADMAAYGIKLKTFGPAADMLENGVDDSDGTDPGKQTSQKIEDFKPQWDQIIQDFQSMPPPDECKPIADDYESALDEISGMMDDINQAIKSMGTDPSAALNTAQKLQGKSGSAIDEPLKRTDREVEDICRKYNTKKWFDIQSDVGSGTLGSMGGF
jgi:hypothetical protein